MYFSAGLSIKCVNSMKNKRYPKHLKCRSFLASFLVRGNFRINESDPRDNIIFHHCSILSLVVVKCKVISP